MVRKLYGIEVVYCRDGGGGGGGHWFENVLHLHLSNSKYSYEIASNKTFSFLDIVLNNIEKNFILNACKSIITINQWI